MVYNLPDALGSVRQVAQTSGQVTLAQSYDPFGGLLSQDGTGVSGFGYTGEQEDASTGLVFLRARYYDPAVGRFVSKDPWPGIDIRPQTQNGWSYVSNNPINRVDPTGLFDEPAIPNSAEWTSAGGLAWEYSSTALERLVKHREQLVAAAQRHNFTPQDICTSSPAQSQLLYTLSSIVYRESLGFDEDGPLEAWAALFGGNFSISLAQIRPDTTAIEIEEAGLLYNPGTLNYPLTVAIPYQEIPSLGDHIATFLGGDPTRKNRISRLLDPVWAIEYTAGNMELARRQDAWYKNPQYPELGRPMAEWEKMAAWHNTGVIDLSDVNENRREEFWKTRLEPYLVGTYKAMLAIETLDLLGIKSECDGGCN